MSNCGKIIKNLVARLSKIYLTIQAWKESVDLSSYCTKSIIRFEIYVKKKKKIMLRQFDFKIRINLTYHPRWKKLINNWLRSGGFIIFGYLANLKMGYHFENNYYKVKCYYWLKKNILVNFVFFTLRKCQIILYYKVKCYCDFRKLSQDISIVFSFYE